MVEGARRPADLRRSRRGASCCWEPATSHWGSPPCCPANRAWGAPLDILAAIGHGRSYGTTSTVSGAFAARHPECGLWEDLQQTTPPAHRRAASPTSATTSSTAAMSTVILRWVETCLERLQPSPIVWSSRACRWPAFDRTPDWKLRLLVSLFFPSSRVDIAHTLAKARELDTELIAFAGRYRAYVVQPDCDWYAWDPIHMARCQRPAAWQKYLACWCDGKIFFPPRGSLHQWFTTVRADHCVEHRRSCSSPRSTLRDVRRRHTSVTLLIASAVASCRARCVRTLRAVVRKHAHDVPQRLLCTSPPVANSLRTSQQTLANRQAFLTPTTCPRRVIRESTANCSISRGNKPIFVGSRLWDSTVAAGVHALRRQTSFTLA